MKRQTDIYYVEKVQKGETACFAPLVERYSKPIFALIVKIVGNREDAEELTQDVFMKAFGSLSTFRGDSNFSTWLYRIAYNQAISSTRKKAIEATTENDEIINNMTDDNTDDIFPDDPDPIEIRLERLNRAMELLSPDERAMLTIFYKDDRSMAEIALITGLTETNVKTKMFRIRKKLYVLMNK